MYTPFFIYQSHSYSLQKIILHYILCMNCCFARINVMCKTCKTKQEHNNVATNPTIHSSRVKKLAIKKTTSTYCSCSRNNVQILLKNIQNRAAILISKCYTCIHLTPLFSTSARKILSHYSNEGQTPRRLERTLHSQNQKRKRTKNRQMRIRQIISATAQ